MMEEEKLRMKEEQGSDYEEEEEDEEEDEPIEEEVELKKESVSSLKGPVSEGGSCDSCEIVAATSTQSDNNNKSRLAPSQDNQVGPEESSVSSPLEATPLRKASLSLPGSPFQRRLSRASNSGSHSYSLRSSGGGRKQWVRSSYLDTREHLPYADDSRVCSPAGSLDGQVIHLGQGWPGLSSHSRHNSYSSHTSRLTYNSHAELTRGRRTNNLTMTRPLKPSTVTQQL